MGIQINPVAAALLVLALIGGYFVFHSSSSSGTTATVDDNNAYAGRPLPTVFYKNHTTNDTERLSREPAVPSVDNTTEPQIVVHPLNFTPDVSSSFEPAPSAPSTHSTSSSGGSGGSSHRSSGSSSSTTQAPVVATNTTVNVTQPKNSTNSTNSTASVNQTQSNTTLVNATNSTPVNNSTLVIPPANVTTNTTANLTNSTLPAPKAELTIEPGFPQDQNFVFRCRAQGADKYDWDFGNGKEVKNDDGTIYHTFPDNGTYQVTCKAKGNGQESTVSKTVTVSTPKKVSADYPYAAFITKSGSGDTYTFTCEDVGYTATGFHWSFSGGQYTSSIAGVNFFDAGSKTMTHTFPGQGIYTISCEAISYDDRMNKAYWDTGQLCNSAQGCIVNSAADSVTIEGQPANNSTSTTNSTTNSSTNTTNNSTMPGAPADTNSTGNSTA